jgi:preprotein translocase subunit SecG
MYTLLILIATIISVLLIIMVLLQSSKGGGLAGTFGGASNMGAMFGTRRTADFLSKGTWWLAGALAIIALVVNLFFLPGQTTPEQRSVIQEGSRTTVPTAPTLPQQTQTPPTNNNQ